MRVCDYIAQRLVQQGVKQVYGLVGGSTSGLNDGIFSNSSLRYVCFHHEQGAGHAAVGEARTTNKLSACNVTAGCGVTNSMTSLLNAYEESAPVLFLSGNTSMANQAKYINRNKGINIRKYGIQDLDAVRTVEHITKYAIAIERADDVPYELEKAIHIALEGRPGPVWIDIPGNLQTAEIPEGYKTYTPEQNPAQVDFNLYIDALTEIYNSKRPLIVAGNGVNLGNARQKFREFVDAHQIPFITTFLSRDLIEYEHPQNLGMMGIKGARAANFAMQNADCLIILGCSMNVTHIGYDSKTFSPASKKIMIDIDANELGKDIFKVDIPIIGDVNDFFHIAKTHKVDYFPTDWVEKCSHWKSKWPIYISEIHRPDTSGVNLYEVVESINRNMLPNDCFIVDAGQPCYILSTNGKYKQDCRYMAQAAQGDMGYAIPASVGAYFADPTLNITVVIGEGSFYTNMQELAVIRQHHIPVKIFVINNDGYMSIKQTQDKFFGGRQWGVSESTGVYFADIAKIAESFEIEYIKVANNIELDALMPEIMHKQNSVIVEFISQPTLDVLPAQAFKPDGTQGGLHDMAPFLTAEELAEEMIVKI
jgi:acetolactate synthase-1/2/3 large subunit